MDERTQRVSDLPHEAGEVPDVVYRITDGEDDDWASFYTDLAPTPCGCSGGPDHPGRAEVLVVGRRFQQYRSFKAAARRANRQGRGAWGVCGGMRHPRLGMRRLARTHTAG